MNELEKALENISKAVKYVSRDSFANLGKVHDLEFSMKIWIEKALASNSSKAISGDLKNILDNFKGYETLDLDNKKKHLQISKELVERIYNKLRDKNEEDSCKSKMALKEFQTPIQFIKGVGPRRQKLLQKLGIETVEDALFFLPKRYEDRSHFKKISEVEIGKLETIYGEIKTLGVSFSPKRRKKIFEMVVGDNSGLLAGKWFHFSEKYVKGKYQKGQKVILNGLVQRYKYEKQMIHPEIEVIDAEDQELLHLGRIVPIYSTTEGLHQKTIRSIMKNVVDAYACNFPEILPLSIRQKMGFIPLEKALCQSHFPEAGVNIDDLNNNRSPGQKRLIFDELFLMELGLALKKKNVVVNEKGIPFNVDSKLYNKLEGIIPFKLTSAQQRVLAEIKADMKDKSPMNRLLQGDVGSGKTIVALMAMLIAVENKYQTAIMAPTEILAEQHYLNIHRLVDELGLKACLLTSGLKKKEKNNLLSEIEEGKINIVIGTHALIQEGVKFCRLGLAVIDEQHRFGVLQRAILKKKGYNPDILVMTATPIPRTLALTVYGDLDISVIDELPPGRKPIKTKVFYENRRAEVYSLIHGEVSKGRQVYVVYPLIEESEKMDLKAATEMAEHLKKDIFPDLNIGLLHGRMKSEQKEEIMNKFKGREIDILVSTTVIEVGVDVPNASLMLIEHAERFGLAQLHQLRGRVGRGGYQSFCLLLVDFPISEDARRRIKVMEKSTDGFVIAEEDLAIRGPGEFFGTRQSGLPDLRVANIIRDQKILTIARQEAFDLVKLDYQLANPEYTHLKEYLQHRWRQKFDLISVG